MAKNESLVFVSASGKKLVLPAFYMGENYFSPDGETFYEMHETGRKSNYNDGFINAEYSFSLPQLNDEVRVHRSNATVTLRDEKFMLSDEPFDPEMVTVVPLPSNQKVEYLCQPNDGTYVCITASQYNYEYDSFRLFVGDGSQMREIPVNSVERFRDGGTTFVYTDEGTSWTPAPPHPFGQGGPQSNPTWKGTGLNRLSPNEYEVVQTDEGVVTTIVKQ